MPELPEVETVCRGLAGVMSGKKIARVSLRRPDLRFPFPQRFAQELEGARVEMLSRRGKYMLWHLDTQQVAIVHLGMSGRFTIEKPGGGPGELGNFTHNQASFAKHDHVVINMAGPGGARLIYNDPRRFGFMDLVAAADLEQCRHFAKMGAEPLGPDFTDDYLAAAMAGRKTPIKQALLDQRLIAGLGNIYVCEALFRAGISPKRAAGRISHARLAELRAHICDVLRDAIAAGGSTLRDFAHADGALGYFQHNFDVYGRENEDCRRCGASIVRIDQGGRSSFYCKACQR